MDDATTDPAADPTSDPTSDAPTDPTADPPTPTSDPHVDPRLADRLAAAFAAGGLVDAQGGRVAAAAVARVVLTELPRPDGAGVPALRLHDAVVVGPLDLAFAEVAWPVHLTGCTFTDPVRLTGATMRTVDLADSALPGFDGRLLEVRGDLRLSRVVVTGPTNLENARVAGTLSLSGAHLCAPGRRALSGGGLVVGGGLIGRQGLLVEGEARLIGARVDGGLLFEGARFINPGGTALCLDEVVTNRLLAGAGFTTEGEFKLREAQVPGQVNLWGARLHARPRCLRARGLVAGELFLLPEEATGLVDLSRARIGALRDDPASWPDQLRLDGVSYDHLVSVAQPVDVVGRIRWLARDPDDYRPQPYEELAAYYRRLGHDDDARRVLLAKERQRRATLGLPARLAGWFLDGLVGYGYRPQLAGLWLAVLVVAGTVVFDAHPPRPLDDAHQPRFSALVYTVDLLIPIGAFGLRTAYDPVGATHWMAEALVAAGWLLATALVAGVSRTVGRD